MNSKPSNEEHSAAREAAKSSSSEVTSSGVSRHPEKLMGAVEELLNALTQLSKSLREGSKDATSKETRTVRGTESSQRPSGSEGESDSSEVQLLRRIEVVGHSYEVVVWGVFMPHLLRNAPALAPATVVELQENHQAEKKHLEVLYLNAAEGMLNQDGARAQVLRSAEELRSLLSKTHGLLSTDVQAAFLQLPIDQRTALEMVMDHELRRQAGEDLQPGHSLFVAADVLEAERPTIPTERPPHAER